MAKTLYLHIGMPKCASTTIQDALKQHAAVFAAHGRFYGFATTAKGEGRGNATDMLEDLRNGCDAKVEQALSFFLDRDSDVILSSEMFISLGLGAWTKILLARATAAGFDIRIICYLRRQDEWIESDYKQHIKAGSEWCGDIEALIAHRATARVLDYSWLLENWARYVARDKITVVPLRRSQGDIHAIERFLTFVDMDPTLAHGLATGRRNVSPAVGLVEPMRFLKAALLAEGVLPRDTPGPLKYFLSEAPGYVTVPQRRFLLSYEQRCALLERYASANARLSERYLDGAAAFDTALEPDCAAQTSLVEEAAEILAACFVAKSMPSKIDAPRAIPRLRHWWPWRRSGL